MKKISLILFLCIIAFSILGAEDKSVIKLIPVYEKTFQDTIVDVIFDTATVSISEAKAMGWKEEAFNEEERAKGEATISYPKVVLIGSPFPIDSKVKGIKFFNSQGNLIKFLKVQKMEGVYISPNSKYILIGKWPDEEHIERQGGKLYNSNGDILTTFNRYFPLAVSDNGYVIAGELQYETEAPGDFVFYDPSGKEIGRVHNPLRNDAEGWSWAIFEEGGNNAFIGYTNTDTKSVILYTTITGKKIWGTSLNYASTFPYELGYCEDYAIGTGYIYNCNKARFEKYCIWAINKKDGKLKWELGTENLGNTAIKINKTSKYIYLSSCLNGEVLKIEIDSGKILWRYKLSGGSPLLFSDLKVINDTLYTIGKEGGRNWHSSTLFVFDGENGKLLKKVEYPLEKITFAKCKEGIGLINITKRKMYIFKKVQK